MEFIKEYLKLFEEIGEGKKMVLSTSSHEIVTSRMMSIIVLGNKFYFQTDKTLRKYQQLCENKNVALCLGNIQIQGICNEIGIPKDNIDFLNAYKKNFFLLTIGILYYQMKDCLK